VLVLSPLQVAPGGRAVPARHRLASRRCPRDACVCDLTDPVGVSRVTVSHHLKQLVEAGLLTREQRGRWSFYRVIDGALNSLAGALRAPTSLP